MTAPPTADMVKKIRTLLESIDGECALSFSSITNPKRSIAINANAPFHAASTMKVPVMVECFRQAEEGRFTLNDEIRVENRFRSIVDESTFGLDPAEDSYAPLYDDLGKRRPIRELMRVMITASSNLATNLLIRRVGADNVTRTMHDLGADGIVVRRGVEDPKAFQEGKNNVTTARGLLVLFEHIARGTAVNEEASAEMIEILKSQEHDTMIPGRLPEGVDVAHKTGWISGVRHDAGIVFVPNAPPFVLVLLSRNLSDVAAAVDTLAHISRSIYDSVQDASA